MTAIRLAGSFRHRDPILIDVFTDVGIACILHDLTVFLENADLQGWEELDVAESALIGWQEGGPEVWEN